MPRYGRSCELGELSSPHVYIRLDRTTHVDDLVADVLALSIAIGPHDELLTRGNLTLDSSLNGLVVLGTRLVHRCAKQLDRIDRLPATVRARELEREQMTRHRCHHHFCLLSVHCVVELVDFVVYRIAISLCLYLIKKNYFIHF